MQLCNSWPKFMAKSRLSSVGDWHLRNGLGKCFPGPNPSYAFRQTLKYVLLDWTAPRCGSKLHTTGPQNCDHGVPRNYGGQVSRSLREMTCYPYPTRVFGRGHLHNQTAGPW